MQKRNLDRAFGFLLHDVSRLLRKEYNRRVRDLGLTRSQCRVVAHLYRNEGVTQSELAEILEIEQATLARLLDRLEAADWVERRPCERDRRAKRLFLTDRPAAAVERMFDVSDELAGDVLHGLAQGERDALIDMLLSVKRNLLAMNGAVPAGEAPAAAPRRAAAGGD